MAHREKAFAILRQQDGLFLNFECSLQIESLMPIALDALAVDFEAKMVWLCGFGNPAAPSELIDRLRLWQKHWASLQVALRRQFKIPGNFDVCPRIFLPAAHRSGFEARFAFAVADGEMPSPMITEFEAASGENHIRKAA